MRKQLRFSGCRTCIYKLRWQGRRQIDWRCSGRRLYLRHTSSTKEIATNHDRELLAFKGLQFGKRREEREDRDDDEGGPGWERLKVPRNAFRTVASLNNIMLSERDGMRKCPSVD